MEITEVRIHINQGKANNLLAYCSIIFDHVMVIHELKIVQGKSRVYVSMPARKLLEKCSNCANKNNVDAYFCNNCGKNLPRNFDKLFVNVMHPIDNEFRDKVETIILEAYYKKLREQ